MLLKFIVSFLFLISLASAAETQIVRPKDIVDLKQVDPSIYVDMMYFSSANFVGHPIDGYKANICLLTQKAADGLKKAQARLQTHGKKHGQHLSLFVRDCYRPQKAVKQFVAWVNSPNELEMKSVFYPDITKPQLISENYISPISGHSHGSTTDLTIVEINEYGDIQPLPMGTPVDFFSEKSHTASTLITLEEKENRQLLKDVLAPEFKNYSKEWWHYVLKVDPYASTFFDFDVEPNNETQPSRKPQSVATNEIVTQFTQTSLMSEMDHDTTSALSLANIFKIIHTTNALPVPTLVATERSRGSVLSLFTETYGKFAATIAADVARVIAELDIDWEKDITKTYDTASTKVHGKNTKPTKEDIEKRKTGDVTRLFNEKWLTSAMGQFLLSGIVNRIDRRDFTPGTCGEVRLIYRLGYETKMAKQTYASRTPFTINVVFNYKDDGLKCQSVAAAWALQSIKDETPAIVAKRLLEGPLDFSKLVFKQMEVNAQVARFTSNLENITGRHFAGQAIYLMRIFNVQNGIFTAKKLENTPDVAAILNSPEKKKQLSDFISLNLSSIDTGVYQIPDSLLADVAISYSTLGSARLANRPFDLLYKPADAQNLLANPSPVTLKFAATGKGLLDRLNTSTCMGCHQTSSTAGFHFLGNDRTDFGTDAVAVKTALDGNRLVLPFSPHLYSELARRTQFVSQLANGVAVNNFRPHPSAPSADWSSGGDPQFKNAGDNMPCPLESENGLGSAATWSCDKSRNLTCTALVTNGAVSSALGQCTPSSDHLYGGLSCRKNDIRDGTASSINAAVPMLAYNLKSYNDNVTTDTQFYKLSEGKISANEYNCRPTRIGVPLGRTTKGCTPNQLALTNLKLDPLPNDVCAIVGGKGFEEMAKGYFNSKVFSEGVNRGILNTCSPGRFCREDYICQEMPDFLVSRYNVKPEVLKAFRDKKVGFCTPTYFVYQLRLDGHPNPQ